jgi:hypothetical protein
MQNVNFAEVTVTEKQCSRRCVIDAQGLMACNGATHNKDAWGQPIVEFPVTAAQKETTTATTYEMFTTSTAAPFSQTAEYANNLSNKFKMPFLPW